MSYEQCQSDEMQPDLRKRFSVKVKGSNRRVVVSAVYYRVQDGVLTFRNNPPYPTQYPETVRAFASGYWLEIGVVEDEQ